MELTAKMLREWFVQFNAEYFENKLPLPQLTVSNARTQLGQFRCRRVRKGLFRGYELTGFAIKVSDYYQLSERDYQQTLLHEMIHYYIAITGVKDSSPHGRLFHQLAQHINEQGGWQITVSERRRNLAVRQENARRQSLLLLLRTTDQRYYLSVVNPNYRNYVGCQAERSPQIADYHFVVSSDSQYTSWTQCRSLRGCRITQEEYQKLMILQP